MKWEDLRPIHNNEVTKMLQEHLPNVEIGEVGVDGITLYLTGIEECDAITGELLAKLKTLVAEIKQKIGSRREPDFENPHVPDKRIRNYSDVLYIEYKTTEIMTKLEPNPIQDRRGRLNLSSELIYKDPNKDILKALFSNFFPYDVQQNHGFGAYRGLTYHGFSEQFRQVGVGEVEPEYVAVFHTEGEKIIKMEFEEKTNI